MRVIINRVNLRAITGDYNPAVSIWRMKMLGELEIHKTQNENNNTHSTLNVNIVHPDE
jgi:hypothetical protein